MKIEFSAIESLTPSQGNVDWVEARKTLVSLDSRLEQEMDGIRHDIDYAAEARREGPTLMNELPRMLDEAQKRLAEGKQSTEAMQYLERGRAQYEDTRRQQSSMSDMDWLLLYSLLDGSRSNCQTATTTHERFNTEPTYKPTILSDDNCTSSFDVGSGFGGGGGFEGGGSSDSSGGSSGSW